MRFFSLLLPTRTTQYIYIYIIQLEYVYRLMKIILLYHHTHTHTHTDRHTFIIIQQYLFIQSYDNNPSRVD